MPALTDSSSSRLGSSTSVSEGFHKHDDPPSSQTDQARESISSLDVSAIFDGDDVVDEDENDVSPIVNTFHPLARPKSFLLPSPSPSPPPVNKPATPLVHHASSSSSSAERYDAIEGLLYRRPSYSAPNQNELSKSRHRLRGATLPALLRRLTSLELSTKDDAWAFLTRSRSLISPVHLLAFLSARFFMDTYRPTSLCHPYNPLTKYRRTDPTHLSKVRSFLNVINIHPKSRCPTSSSGEKLWLLKTKHVLGPVWELAGRSEEEWQHAVLLPTRCAVLSLLDVYLAHWGFDFNNSVAGGSVGMENEGMRTEAATCLRSFLVDAAESGALSLWGWSPNSIYSNPEIDCPALFAQFPALSGAICAAVAADKDMKNRSKKLKLTMQQISQLKKTLTRNPTFIGKERSSNESFNPSFVDPDPELPPSFNSFRSNHAKAAALAISEDTMSQLAAQATCVLAAEHKLSQEAFDSCIPPPKKLLANSVDKIMLAAEFAGGRSSSVDSADVSLVEEVNVVETKRVSEDDATTENYTSDGEDNDVSSASSTNPPSIYDSTNSNATATSTVVPRMSNASTSTTASSSTTTTTGSKFSIFSTSSFNTTTKPLTLHLHFLYASIPLREITLDLSFSHSKDSTDKKGQQHLARFRNESERVPNVFISAILEISTVSVRGKLVAFLVEVCEELYRIRSLHGLMLVLSALQSNPIHRLKKSWAAAYSMNYSAMLGDDEESEAATLVKTTVSVKAGYTRLLNICGIGGRNLSQVAHRTLTAGDAEHRIAFPEVPAKPIMPFVNCSLGTLIRLNELPDEIKLEDSPLLGTIDTGNGASGVARRRSSGGLLLLKSAQKAELKRNEREKILNLSKLRRTASIFAILRSSQLLAYDFAPTPNLQYHFLKTLQFEDPEDQYQQSLKLEGRKLGLTLTIL